MLVVLAIGGELAHSHQEWFLNTLVLWLAALVLISLLRGPLRSAPALLRKPLKFVVASLIALGFAIFLLWEPIALRAKQSGALTAIWILLSGLTPIGWVVSFFWIFLARPQRKTGSAPVAVGGTVQRPARHGRGKGRNPPGSAGTSESGKIRTLRAGEKWNPSVRTAWDRENIPGESDRW